MGLEIPWGTAPRGFKSPPLRHLFFLISLFQSLNTIISGGANLTQTEFRHRIRISKTDVEGQYPLEYVLQDIAGIGRAMAKAILRVTGLDGKQQAGYLSDEDVKKIEDVLLDPAKHGIPSWMFNRRKDVYSGVDKHLIETDLMLAVQEDITTMKKIRCYRGIRHELRLPCRGQRTRGSFRHGTTVGVKRRK